MTDDLQRRDLSDSLAKTLVKSDLSDVAMKLGEVSLDACLDAGLARDIPVIGTLVGLWKAGVSVKDSLFLRKLATFFGNLKDIPLESRREMLALLADSTKQETVGEKLLALLDSFDSAAKAKLLARAFSAYIETRISADEFWRASFIIDRLPMSDILAIPEWRSTNLNKVEHVRKHLYLSVGLGWFVLDASSTGFVWEERLCSIFADLLIPESS